MSEKVPLSLDITSSIESRNNPEDNKEQFITYIEQKLPEDNTFWKSLESVEGTINASFQNNLGIQQALSMVESKADFIQLIQDTTFLEGSLKQLIRYTHNLEDQFYTNPRGMEDLKTQVRLHMRLADMHKRVQSIETNNSINDSISNLILQIYLEDKALTDLSTEEIEELDALFDLYDRLIYVYQLYSQNKDYLAEKVSEELKGELEAFRNQPYTIGNKELERIEYSINWGVKVFALQDAFGRYKNFMPEYIQLEIQGKLDMYAANPRGVGTEEYENLLGRIERSKQYFDQMRATVVEHSDIDSFWPDFTFDKNSEPYSTLFSTLTVLYMEEYANSIKNADDFLSENKQGLHISKERLTELLKEAGTYLVDTKFENAIELTLSDGSTIEITSIISGQQEKVELARKQETKVILSFFSLLNNKNFPKTQKGLKTDMRTISNIIGVGSEELISQIEGLGIMSSIEQSKDFSDVKNDMLEMVSQGLITPGQIYKIVASFVKPGTKAGLDIVSELKDSGLIHDSDALHLLEGPNGFQEGGISLNDYLKKNGFPQKMKDAINIILGRELSEKELNNILIDTLYVHAIETRGGYNIKNDVGGNASGYEQIIATNGRFNSNGGWDSSSLGTGLKFVPSEVLDLYPELKELREGMPGRVSDPKERERIQQEMKKRDPRKLSAEAQMIWRIVDSYVRRESAKPYVEKILDGDFSGTEYIYATVHHTEGLTHGPTKRAMQRSGQPILDSKQVILANLARSQNTMIASVFDGNFTDIAQLLQNQNTVSTPVDKQVPQQVKQESIVPSIQYASEFYEEKVNPGDTLGGVVYALIKEAYPKTSFSGSGEVAVYAEQLGNIPFRVGDTVQVARVKSPSEYAYYVKVGNTEIAVKSDKTFQMLG